MTSVIGRLYGIVLPNAIASVLAAGLLAGCAYIQSALPAPADIISPDRIDRATGSPLWVVS